MDIRYPIGTFQYPGEISFAQLELRIKDIEELPTKLKEAVKDLSEEQLDMSYREGGWKIRQVVHHLADSHMNSYIRFKLALTEDNPTIKPYEEDRWANLPDSEKGDVSISLTLIDALHQRWVTLLKLMESSDFKKHFYHPGSKQTITLDSCVELYAWHGNHHLAHITTARNRLGI